MRIRCESCTEYVRARAKSNRGHTELHDRPVALTSTSTRTYELRADTHNIYTDTSHGCRQSPTQPIVRIGQSMSPIRRKYIYIYIFKRQTYAREP